MIANKQALSTAVLQPNPSMDSTSIEMPKRVGLIIFFLVFGVFGVWAAFAPINGAAHAAGTVLVKSNNKIVQHLEGGIVSEIEVQNGDFVNSGDALLTLDNTQSLAQLGIFRSQYIALKARESRLIAERDVLDSVVFPVDLSANTAAIQEERNAQLQIFAARKAANDGEKAVLEQRIEQLQSRVTGLKAVRESKDELAQSFSDELQDIQALLDQGFSDKTRLRAIERNYSVTKGEAAEIMATISATEVQIGETRLQILQKDRDFQNEVVTELSDTQTNLNDVTERMVALEDVVNRTVIRAPVAGIVNGMQVHTEGGVIAPGSAIAEIIPQAEELIVEARVSLNDIDRIAEGQDATIRFSSFSGAVPTIFGKVINVSASSIVDRQTGIPYYLARVEVTPEGMAELGALTLVPGMPAEVFIATGARTFLQYSFKPFTNAMARSFIED